MTHDSSSPAAAGDATRTWAAAEFATLAARAARGAGFDKIQARDFGRAAAMHMAEGRDPAAVEAALADVRDSPILRLPLLMQDVLRAARVTGPTVSVSVLRDDRPLAPGYAASLPVRLRGCSVEEGPPRGPDRFRATVTDEDPVDLDGMPAVEVPEPLVRHLSRLARACAEDAVDRDPVTAPDQPRGPAA